MKVLEVSNLTTYYTLREGFVSAVDKVSFFIDEGATFGIAGESGCGKTTMALSIMRILPENGQIIDGQITLDGEDILAKSDDEMKKVRWKHVSMVFQYAMNAFNPVLKVGEQIVEAIMSKEQVRKEDAWDKASQLFEVVGLDPSRVTDYPHEFSGGMKQRAIIAQALACDPKLIIADEPVTALDVIVQAKILNLLQELQKEFNLAVMLITHDLSVIAEVCDQVGIMYAGKLMERGSAEALFKQSKHPYTKKLIGAFPSVTGEKKHLEFIPGTPPNLLNPPSGCRFHPRCYMAQRICETKEPHFADYGNGHFSACHFAEKVNESD
ncbi:MAG: ABC transporter ATP-binding protein [Candidatus Heimdallarchaeota archaeon]